MTRREFLVSSAAVTAFPMRVFGRAPSETLRLAVVTDLHHGLAPDAMVRLQAFVDAVGNRKGLDAVLQLGDYCYSQPESTECTDLFAKIDLPKLHVLGNHDMDKVDKTAAMAFFGTYARYSSRVIGGWRFVVLDLNHFKKDGKLVSYANGNYFTDGVTHNWADAEQLDWLGRELRSSKEPVVLLSHQPLGFGDPLPPEQKEVMDVVEAAAKENPKGAVAVSMFGHLHVDRLEHVGGVPYYCVNSASYFWSGGMQPYTKPLYAFMELGSDGVLKVEGVKGEFVHAPPKESDGVAGRSASISDREIGVRRSRTLSIVG